MRVDGTYRVVALDFATGTYTLIYELDWMHASAHTNAVGLVNARIGGVKQNYLLGAFSTELCFFDGEGMACFDGTLDHRAPNAGVAVGSDYYYTKSLGQDPGGQTKIFVVKDVDTKSPVFSTSTAVVFSTDLWYAGLVDITGVVEGRGDGDVRRAVEAVVVRAAVGVRPPDEGRVLLLAYRVSTTVSARVETGRRYLEWEHELEEAPSIVTGEEDAPLARDGVAEGTSKQALARDRRRFLPVQVRP